jgi:hypothetical protein
MIRLNRQVDLEMTRIMGRAGTHATQLPHTMFLPLYREVFERV